jgi:hypothetical protein
MAELRENPNYSPRCAASSPNSVTGRPTAVRSPPTPSKAAPQNSGPSHAQDYASGNRRASSLYARARLSIRPANARRRDEPSPEIVQDCRIERAVQHMCQMKDEYPGERTWSCRTRCGSRHGSDLGILAPLDLPTLAAIGTFLPISVQIQSMAPAIDFNPLPLGVCQASQTVTEPTPAASLERQHASRCSTGMAHDASWPKATVRAATRRSNGD